MPRSDADLAGLRRSTRATWPHRLPTSDLPERHRSSPGQPMRRRVRPSSDCPKSATSRKPLGSSRHRVSRQPLQHPVRRVSTSRARRQWDSMRLARPPACTAKSNSRRALAPCSSTFRVPQSRADSPTSLHLRRPALRRLPAPRLRLRARPRLRRHDHSSLWPHRRRTPASTCPHRLATEGVISTFRSPVHHRSRRV